MSEACNPEHAGPQRWSSTSTAEALLPSTCPRGLRTKDQLPQIRGLTRNILDAEALLLGVSPPSTFEWEKVKAIDDAQPFYPSDLDSLPDDDPRMQDLERGGEAARRARLIIAHEHLESLIAFLDLQLSDGPLRLLKRLVAATRDEIHACLLEIEALENWQPEEPVKPKELAKPQESFLRGLTGTDFDQVDRVIIALAGQLGCHPVELISIRFGTSPCCAPPHVIKDEIADNKPFFLWSRTWQGSHPLNGWIGSAGQPVVRFGKAAMERLDRWSLENFDDDSKLLEEQVLDAEGALWWWTDHSLREARGNQYSAARQRAFDPFL